MTDRDDAIAPPPAAERFERLEEAFAALRDALLSVFEVVQSLDARLRKVEAATARAAASRPGAAIH